MWSNSLCVDLAEQVQHTRTRKVWHLFGSPHSKCAANIHPVHLLIKFQEFFIKIKLVSKLSQILLKLQNPTALQVEYTHQGTLGKLRKSERVVRFVTSGGTLWCANSRKNSFGINTNCPRPTIKFRTDSVSRSLHQRRSNIRTSSLFVSSAASRSKCTKLIQQSKFLRSGSTENQVRIINTFAIQLFNSINATENI